MGVRPGKTRQSGKRRERGGHDVDFDVLFPLTFEYRRPEGKFYGMAETNPVFSVAFLKGLGRELGEEEGAAPPSCPGPIAGRTCLGGL